MGLDLKRLIKPAVVIKPGGSCGTQVAGMGQKSYKRSLRTVSRILKILLMSSAKVAKRDRCRNHGYLLERGTQLCR